MVTRVGATDVGCEIALTDSEASIQPVRSTATRFDSGLMLRRCVLKGGSDDGPTRWASPGHEAVAGTWASAVEPGATHCCDWKRSQHRPGESRCLQHGYRTVAAGNAHGHLRRLPTRFERRGGGWPAVEGPRVPGIVPGVGTVGTGPHLPRPRWLGAAIPAVRKR